MTQKAPKDLLYPGINTILDTINGHRVITPNMLSIFPFTIFFYIGEATTVQRHKAETKTK